MRIPVYANPLQLILTVVLLLSGCVSQVMAVHIRGRVLDQVGQPVPNASVKAGAPVLGQNFWWAQSELIATRSDEDGRFTLPLPFADLRYQVVCEKWGYSLSRQNVLADEDREIELRLETGPHERTLTGRVLDDSDRPGAAVPVRFVGEYGVSAETTTDAQGAFTFTDLPEPLGQGYLFAHQDKKVATALVYMNKRDPVDLRLANPATFEGTAIEESTGDPVEGVTVTVWDTRTGYKLSTTTDAAGKWRITGVPPGKCKYVVEPQAPDHFNIPPRGYSHERPKHDVLPGQTITVNATLQRKATISGSVVDRNGLPVDGALVCARMDWVGDYRQEYRWVATDAQGKFAFKTAHMEESLEVQVAHGRHGLARTTINPLTEGAAVSGLQFSLPGTQRVRATVTTPDGKPIRNVACSAGGSSDLTDDRGRVDLGLVSLASHEQRYALSLVPPRPYSAHTSSQDPQTGSFIPVKNPDPPTAYFIANVHEFAAEPDQRVDLRVELKPAELLTIRGRLMDVVGRPLRNSSVHVFAGTPDDQWVIYAVPTYLQTGRLTFSRAVELGGTVVGPDGRFSVQVLRHEGEPAEKGTRYAVGVVQAGGASKLVKDVIVPADEREVDLRIVGKGDILLY